MFSLSDTPVQIDGVFFAEMGQGTALSPVNGEHTDFSQVLAKLQQLDGDMSPEKMAENPAMLDDLGLSSEHLQMLQRLLKDGKNLPEAAQAVLFDLKQELAELLSMEPSTEQIEKIGSLQEEVAALLEFLPQDLGTAVAAELQALSQLIEPLKLKLETVAGSDVSEDNKNITQVVSISENSEESTEHVEQPVIDAAQDEAEAAENASLAAAMVHQEPQTSQTDNRKTDQAGNARITAATQNAANKPNQGNGPAFLQNEIADTDAEYELHTEGKPVVENKLMPNLISQQATSRVAQFQMNEHAMSSQAITKFSGQGAGSNLQSGGNNASYTQLMTQTIPSPVSQNIHKPEWGNAIGQRITWMIGNKLQGAQLRITPAHLGPVDIKISIESGVAQVSFASNHQVVRDALEQAVPRLRDMLENQNLELGDVDISDRSLADSRSMRDEFAHSQGRVAESGSEAELAAQTEEQAVTHVLQSDALLDAYA